MTAALPLDPELIRAEFPAFRDGRGFSWARMLRTRLNFTGEVRATGAFLFIYGLAVPRAILVRNDLGSISLAPVRMGKDGSGNGLALFGTF